MFLLGEYYEDVARDIADRLKEVGMKVDIRTFTASRLEVFHYLEGRMSVMKGELDEKTFERHERYINVLRKVLAEGATPEDFRKRLQLEIDPQADEKRKLFCEILEGDLSKEELEAKRKESSELMGDLLAVSNAEAFIDVVLERNDIQIGDEIGGRLDDPVLRIFDDDEDEGEKSELARTTTVFTVEPRAQVFIDEFYAVLAEELDDEFEDQYDDEYMRLVLLGKLMTHLREPSVGKMDMQAFRERCEFEMENSGDLLDIDGSRAAEELARSLEKSGIIKVKGNSVKWKK